MSELEVNADIAVRLASEGFYVFPIRQFKKDVPLVKHIEKSTRSPSAIGKWSEKFGAVNWGISTHRFGKGNALVVVDVDVKKGKDGNATLELLALAGDVLPVTREHASPSGGRHLIYRVPSPVKQGVDVLGPGVDIRSSGGYVLAPGSKLFVGKSIVPYTVLTEAPIVDAPAWLIERCGAPRTRSANREPNPAVDSARAHKRALDYLKTAPEAIQGAAGDHTTFTVAARLKDLGVTQDVAVDLLLEHWFDGCGWTATELAEKVGNAWKYGANAPGADAPEAVFEPVVDDLQSAHAWDRGQVAARGRDLYLLRQRDAAHFDQLRQSWEMFDTIDDAGLQALLVDAALQSVGIEKVHDVTADGTADARVQLALAKLKQKDPQAFGWAEEAIIKSGVGKRQFNASVKGGTEQISRQANERARRKDPRAIVTYNAGNVAVTVDAMEAAMLADPDGEPVFKYAGGYVAVRTAAPTTVRELSGGGDYPPMAIIHRHDLHSMSERISRSIRIERPPVAKGAAPKPVAPPEAAVRMLLSRRGGAARVLTGIIEAPTVRSDGSVLAAPGHDQPTGLYAAFAGRVFDVPENTPTQKDAAVALHFLEQDMFDEFPFAEPVDRTAAVAALITGVIRPVMKEPSPGFLLSSPTQGTGKTALAQAICHGAFGRPAAAQSWPGSDEEMSKFLLGALREGQRGVVFDNLRDGTLVDNAELATAMTSNTYSRRCLGGHDNITVPTAVLWLITGNNVRPAGDMPSRLVEIYLDANSARPDQRHFRRNLVDWVAGRRPQIIAAVITIVRAYLAAGCPSIEAKPTRFAEWDKMVRLPLIYAGGPDVGVKFDKAYANDPGLEAWGEVLASWAAVFGNKAITTKELLARLDGPDFDGPVRQLETALQDVVGNNHRRDSMAKTIGRQLAKYVNRPVGPWRLRDDGVDRTNVKRWAVEAVPG